jgi:hypothetical protein
VPKEELSALAVQALLLSGRGPDGA